MVLSLCITRGGDVWNRHFILRSAHGLSSMLLWRSEVPPTAPGNAARSSPRSVCASRPGVTLGPPFLGAPVSRCGDLCARPCSRDALDGLTPQLQRQQPWGRIRVCCRVQTRVSAVTRRSLRSVTLRAPSGPRHHLHRRRRRGSGAAPLSPSLMPGALLINNYGCLRG